MNAVVLVGRLTADTELRYSKDGQTAIGSFTLAVRRKFSKEKKADFIRIKVFGRSAENCEKYLKKGNLAGIQGRIQIDFYDNEEGRRIYVTEVIADTVSFLEPKDKRGDDSKYTELSGFKKVDDDDGYDGIEELEPPF